MFHIIEQTICLFYSRRATRCGDSVRHIPAQHQGALRLKGEAGAVNIDSVIFQHNTKALSVSKVKREQLI